jgi:hypothetical protein
MTDGPYHVKYTLWDTSGDTRETTIHEGFFNEPSPIDCVNAICYDYRGDKSRWELAYIDEIEPVGEDDD